MPFDPIVAATREYLERCRGEAFPEGIYDYEVGFTPLPSEVCPMCAGLMADERCSNELLYTHCLTAKHIALKYGLDADTFEHALIESLSPKPVSEETDGVISSKVSQDKQRQ